MTEQMWFSAVEAAQTEKSLADESGDERWHHGQVEATSAVGGGEEEAAGSLADGLERLGGMISHYESLGDRILSPLQDLADEISYLGLEALSNEVLGIVHRWWLLDHLYHSDGTIRLGGAAIQKKNHISQIVT